MEVKLADGVAAKLEGGVFKIEAQVGALVVPAIDGVIAKVESGEIDPIKGTDLDKEVMIKALNMVKAYFV